MKFQFIFLYLVSFALTDGYAQQSKIVIELETADDVGAANYEIWTKPQMDEIHFTGRYEKHRFSKQSNGIYSLSILTNVPKIISNFSRLPFSAKLSSLLMPGDSVRIRKTGAGISITGRGAEVFAYLAEAADICKDNNYDSLLMSSLQMPRSEDDFWSFISSFGGNLMLLDDLLGNYKNKLAPASFSFFKAQLMAEFQNSAGVLISHLFHRHGDLKLSGNDLSGIYDEVLAKYGRLIEKPVDTLGITISVNGLAPFARISYLRSKNFNATESWLDSWIGTYYYCKSKFSSLTQARLLTYIVTFYLIRESPGDDIAYEPIKDYLSLPGYADYKRLAEKWFLSKFKVSFYDIGPDKRFKNRDLYRDGPYVFRDRSSTVAKYVDVIDEKTVVRVDTIPDNGTVLVPIKNADAQITLKVRMNDKVNIEDSEYSMPFKLLAISDIEGNLDAFIKLLQSNGVVDSHLNWIFGTGHLVLNGDFVDRGTQVTEVLWLIYSLETQAKEKNGYVHLILGNHEIMNLSNFTSYVHKKYLDNARLLNEDYASGLYGKRSEMGRWLRTKNVVEKIGDILFTHAGISLQVNNLEKGIGEINQLARQYYEMGAKKSADGPAGPIMSSSVGPFWYRGYYEEYKNATLNQVDSSLKKFGVNKIVTGHTIIGSGEKITVHFRGKVINVDTYHAGGKSEALMVENGTYYRVSINGRRVRLFDEKLGQLADGR